MLNDSFILFNLIMEFTSHCFEFVIPFSYLSNPALGDAHSLEVEMALMRHTMRDKESDIALIQGKVCFILCNGTVFVKCNHSLIQTSSINVCLQTDSLC